MIVGEKERKEWGERTERGKGREEQSEKVIVMSKLSGNCLTWTMSDSRMEYIAEASTSILIITLTNWDQ